MEQLVLLSVLFCLLAAPAATTEWDDDLDSSSGRPAIKADVVLAVDTAFYGWGDRSERDVFVDALRPFLRHFTEILWNTTSQGLIRVAVVEMAKDSSVLVELMEGTSPKAVTDAFNEKNDRRLSLDDRRSTTHIYRMLNLVNVSVCNRSDPDTSCVLVVVTVAPAPVRVPFVGADWPSWRKLADAVIRTAFDYGVDIMVLTTGYHEYAGSAKTAGLSEMARVEGRLRREAPSRDSGTKPDWALTYWQAGYDREKSVDERVAKRTVAVLYQVLATPPDEISTKEEKTPEERSKPVAAGEAETPYEEKKGYEGLLALISSTLIATVFGFSLKQLWRLIRGDDNVSVFGNFLKVCVINTLFVLFVFFLTWLYSFFAEE